MMSWPLSFSARVVRREHSRRAPERPQPEDRHDRRRREVEGDTRHGGEERVRHHQVQGLHLLGHRALGLAAGEGDPHQREQRPPRVHLHQGELRRRLRSTGPPLVQTLVLERRREKESRSDF